MKEYKSGTYILHKGYKPFNPSFINDDIDWKLDELAPLLQDASLWLGKLNSYADLIQTLSENLQPKCNFLLYICPLNATFKGRGGDKNINSHPDSEPQKNSVNF